MNADEICQIISQTPPDEAGDVVVRLLNQRHGDVVLGLAWDTVYFDCVSNSHCAPRGGVQNWTGREKGPRGYPGFSGRVWMLLSNISHRFSPSDMLRNVFIHPGTGGFGTYNGPWTDLYREWQRLQDSSPLSHKRFTEKHPEPQVHSWDIKMFCQDWSRLHDDLAAMHAFNILKDEVCLDSDRINFQYEWTNPRVREVFNLPEPTQQHGELA